jgi:hypothetical protein
LEASASEPEPVLSLRTLIGLLGWLTVLTGIFLLILGNSSLCQASCTTKLTAYSTAATVAGALILATAWLTGERGDKTPLKMSLKMLAKYLLSLVGLAILITVILFLAFLGLTGP